MVSTNDILVIGGSFAGRSAAHQLLKHLAPTLETHASGQRWRIRILDPSTHWWWRIAAPRAMVTTDTVPHDKAFMPISEGFEQYSHLKRMTVEYVQAECTDIDFDGRSVTVKHLGAGSIGKVETLPYYALIIASGTRTPTPLTSIHGDHAKSVAALDEMQQRLASGTVKDIVIAGGGPTGVETAGEIGEALNGAPGWFSRGPANPNVKITLVTSSRKLLPNLSQGNSDKADKFLQRVGVNVVYGVRVDKVEDAKSGSSSSKKVVLNDGSTLAADIYIPAAGTQPNSEFVPSKFLNPNGYVSTAKTLRVTGAGPRVYCVGDVADYSPVGGVMGLYEAIPVLGANLAADLWLDLDAKKSKADREYVEKSEGSQFVPIGRSKGVGAMNGWSLPSFLVSMAKGRDYLLSMTPQLAQGTKW